MRRLTIESSQHGVLIHEPDIADMERVNQWDVLYLCMYLWYAQFYACIPLAFRAGYYATCA